MSTKRDPKGDVLSKADRAVVNGDVPRLYGTNPAGTVQALIDEDAQLRHSLDELVNDDSGYLKIRRGTLGPEVHITWTYTLTEHAGHYVYVRVDYWKIHEGLDLLCSKIRAVALGQLRPTPDKRRDNSA